MTKNLTCYNRGYSAHEHTTLYSNVALAASTSSSTPTTATNFFAVVPLDITIETLIAVVLVSAGLVSGAEKLKPVTHSAWAGQIEREGGAKNPYKNLEIRSGFWDVRVCFIPFAFSLIVVRQVLTGSFTIIEKSSRVCGLDAHPGPGKVISHGLQ